MKNSNDLLQQQEKLVQQETSMQSQKVLLAQEHEELIRQIEALTTTIEDPNNTQEEMKAGLQQQQQERQLELQQLQQQQQELEKALEQLHLQQQDLEQEQQELERLQQQQQQPQPQPQGFIPSDLAPLQGTGNETAADKLQNERINLLSTHALAQAREHGVLGHRLDLIERTVAENERNTQDAINRIFQDINDIRSELSDDANEGNEVTLDELGNDIVVLTKQYDEAKIAFETAEGHLVDKRKEELKDLDKQINEAAGKYLDASQAQDNGSENSLMNVIRKKLTTKDTAPATTWGALKSVFTTDKEAKAVRSTLRLANNAAFSESNFVHRTDEDLETNSKIIALMTKAIFALDAFRAHYALSDNEALNQAAPSSHRSPKKNSQSTDYSTKDQRARQNTINRAVLTFIQVQLEEALTWKDGLIGSKNESLQFYGKLLMVLALAVALTVAAIGIAFALGFTAPAFMASYIAAIQTNVLVSSVLNLVASKLALDLSTAAAVTVVTAAGTFGMFGKGLHMAGAPTSLKKDLDKAVTDIDAAISSTPAMSM